MRTTGDACLVGVKYADDLIQRDLLAGRVDQVQRVVEVAALAIYLARRADASADVHKLRRAHLVAPIRLGCKGGTGTAETLAAVHALDVPSRGQSINDARLRNCSIGWVQQERRFL